MPATITAHDLRPAHAQRPILMPRHRTRDAVKVRRPAAAGLELVLRGVQRRVAARAVVRAGAGRVLVVGACEGGFGRGLPEDAELLCVVPWEVS